jgi:hypothetical protein
MELNGLIKCIFNKEIQAAPHLIKRVADGTNSRKLNPTPLGIHEFTKGIISSISPLDHTTLYIIDDFNAHYSASSPYRVLEESVKVHRSTIQSNVAISIAVQQLNTMLSLSVEEIYQQADTFTELCNRAKAAGYLSNMIDYSMFLAELVPYIWTAKGQEYIQTLLPEGTTIDEYNNRARNVLRQLHSKPFTVNDAQIPTRQFIITNNLLQQLTQEGKLQIGELYLSLYDSGHLLGGEKTLSTMIQQISGREDELNANHKLIAFLNKVKNHLPQQIARF